MLSTPVLASGTSEALAPRDVVASRQERSAAVASGVRRPVVAPFVVAFLVIAIVGNLTWRPLDGPVNWWFSVVCLLPLQASLLHLAGAIRTHRLLGKPSTAPPLSYRGAAGDRRRVPDFYAQYSAATRKPLMIAETSALYLPRLTSGASDLQIKRDWWGQVLAADTPAVFPNLRAILWFEPDK